MTPTHIWRALKGLFTFAPKRIAAIASSAALIAAVLVNVPVQPASANSCLSGWTVKANGQCSRTFSFTGAEQSFVLPAGISELEVDISGAAGGDGSNSRGFGGGGARVQATVPVSAGTVYIFVGGQGPSGTTNRVNVNNPGGYNGGGGTFFTSDDNKRPGSGGGATDIRIGGTSLSNRIAVAGGGGGGGGWEFVNGGAGGRIGGDGQLGPAPALRAGGTGGTLSAGGTGANSGTLGVGGRGTGNTHGGGGGGGGYYGGGGGSVAPGGGGSSFVAEGSSNINFTSGARAGDGTATISYGSVTLTSGICSATFSNSNFSLSQPGSVCQLVFSASGTLSVSTVTLTAIVAVGGGGGGANDGGQGGTGGQLRSWTGTQSITGNQAVEVGFGGYGAVHARSSSEAGGSSRFASLVTSLGGNPGIAAGTDSRLPPSGGSGGILYTPGSGGGGGGTSSTSQNGKAGGSGAAGTFLGLSVPGGGGGGANNSGTTIRTGGIGGSTGGGTGASYSSNATAGSAPGAGGGGGSSFASSTAQVSGANGASGRVVIQYLNTPNVTAFNRVTATPTNAATATYSLTFDQATAGIAGTDFENAGTASCTFAAPTSASANTAITVTATCTNDGTLQPRLKMNSVHLSGNTTAVGPAADVTSSQVLVIDRTAPTITLTPVTASPTKATTLVFRVTSNESLSPAPATSNFTVTGSGCSVSSVTTHTTNQWNVNVTGCAHDQQVALTLTQGALKDPAGNTAPPSAITTASIVTDYVAPALTVARPATPTNALTHPFVFTPTETLNRDLALADFVLTQTNGTGCAFSADGLVKDAPSVGSYSLTVACVEATAHESAFNITVAAGSTAGGAALADTAGNLSVAVTSAQTAVTIDRFTTISSITVDPNPATGFTNAANIDYTINFSEPVSHLTLNQISVIGTGCQPAITSPAVLDDTGARYTQATIRVGGCGHGVAVQFAIAASASGVKDAVGNTALKGVTTASVITIDRVAPEFVSAAPTTANGTSFHSSSTISYSFIFDEPVTGLTADMFTATACNGTTTVSGSGTSYTVTFAGCVDGPITPIASLTGDIKDLADNPHAVQTVNLPAVTIDTVAPTVEWEALAQGAELTNASSISFAIVFSETIDASSFTGDDITNAGTATGCNFAVTEDAGAVTPSTRFIVTATSCYDLGASATVQPRITNGSVTDRAGNALRQTEQLRTATAVTLDRTVPTASFTSGPPQRTNAALSYSLLFSEPISGLTNADFEFSGSADECLISITPDATNPTTVFDVAVTGCTDGTFSLILKANSVADSATNLGPSFDVTAAQITIDTVPAVATVTATGGVAKSRDSFVTFDISFNEPVYGLVADTNAFEVGGTGCQVGTLTPSGLTTFAQAVANYSLTITGCADATDATLAVKPDAATDVAGNLGPATLSPAASIEIDRVAAEVVSFTAAAANELGEVEFTVTFNEPIADATVSAADFEPATGSVPLVTPFTVTRVSSTQYAVATQALTQGDASVRLKANSITDAIGNPSPLAAQDSEPAAVTLPALSGGFSLQPAPNAGGFVNSTTLRYELALSRAIDTADAQKTLTAADLDLGAISCDNTVITPLQPFLLAIELTGCGNGPITLGIKPDSITDPDGNTWPATQLNAATFEYDTVAPTATITAPINSQFLVRHEFVLQFSEPVSGFSAATDITLAAGSTATGCQFGFITETTSRYRVVASNCSDGTIGITLAQNAVTDRAGNQGPAAAVTSASITQNPPPTAPAVSRVAPPDPTDPNSPNFDPNFDPNAPAPSQPTVLARAPERFIGPLSFDAQAQLVAAGVVRVDQVENFALNSVTASFDGLPEWNTPAQIAKQLSITAGELVLVEVGIHQDASPYMQAQGYLKTDDGWVTLGNHDFDTETSVLSVPAMFANPGNYFMRIVMVETGAPPAPPVIVSLGGFSTASFSPATFGIASTLTDEQVMGLGTQALELDITVTGTPLTLTPLPTSAPSYDGPLVDNTPVRVTTLGGAATFTGQKLSLVSGARVLGAAQPIQSATANALTLTVLPLEPGLYDLELTGSFGRLTIQGALEVVSLDAALGGLSPSQFVTRHIGNNQVKVYAKDIVAIGKVQFFVDGRELAWARAVDETDPKLRFANGSNYLVRTVQLKPGKNRIEIRVNNLRVKFATYSGE